MGVGVLLLKKKKSHTHFPLTKIPPTSLFFRVGSEGEWGIWKGEDETESVGRDFSSLPSLHCTQFPLGSTTTTNSFGRRRVGKRGVGGGEKRANKRFRPPPPCRHTASRDSRWKKRGREAVGLLLPSHFPEKDKSSSLFIFAACLGIHPLLSLPLETVGRETPFLSQPPLLIAPLPSLPLPILFQEVPPLKREKGVNSPSQKPDGTAGFANCTYRVWEATTRALTEKTASVLVSS